jgi:hypothetical protein
MRIPTSSGASSLKRYGFASKADAKASVRGYSHIEAHRAAAGAVARLVEREP